MNKKIFIVAFITACLFYFNKTLAQNDTIRPTYKVAVFAPLYLDSVFSNTGFKYNSIPKFIMPAVDFVQGAQIALDSMKPGNENIEAFIYDSKSYKRPISYLIENKLLDSLSLIIGNVKDDDYKQLARFALQKQIPFISATYPNDGGIKANPFVVILNSTLKAHCDAIYTYILQNHGTDKVFLCRQKGSQEDMVASFFKLINEQDGKPLVNIETINFDNNLNADYLKTKLDSNQKSIIIGASLDETFASNIASACYNLKDSYPITLLGMPTWDGFSSLHKKDEYTDFPIYFTTPYFNNKWDVYSRMVKNAYAKKYKSKPTDMAFKGFEATYLFIKLFTKYPVDFMNQINDKTAKVFSDFNFRPVYLKKENTIPDYFENKHLYFLKILNGSASKAW